LNWAIVGTGDFDGDGSTDILWRDSTTGTLAIWFMTPGLQVAQTASFTAVPADWSIAETGDFNGDGKSDILWRHQTDGATAIWFMNGLQTPVAAFAQGFYGPEWQIQGANAD
jgi:hypothetical protein